MSKVKITIHDKNYSNLIFDGVDIVVRLFANASTSGGMAK
jgi:hypothetical protein